MKNDLYFKHDAGAAGNQKMMRLIDELGMKGYGAYWLLQETLRKQQNYRAPISIVRRLARQARVMPAFLLRVIENYDLFVMDEACFYSPGMMRRMRAYDAKAMPTLHEDAPPATPNSLNDNESSLPNAHVKREDKKREETPPKLTPLQVRHFVNGVDHWEQYIDEAFTDRAWLEVIAMHSGMGTEFVTRLAEIQTFFKRHIRTYGKEPTVCSVADAKSYFGNFIRQGTPTLQALRAELVKDGEKRKKDDLYRYEERDAQTGQRTYCGQVIPPDAPPRPSENAVWSDTLREWSE
ncbi:DUF7833 domain-containing protein [Bacteroides sp.]